MQRPVVVRRRRPLTTTFVSRSASLRRSRSRRSGSARSSRSSTVTESGSLARFEGRPISHSAGACSRAGAGDSPRGQARPTAPAARLRSLRPRSPLARDCALDSSSCCSSPLGLVRLASACGGSSEPSAEEFAQGGRPQPQPGRLRPRAHHACSVGGRASHPHGRSGGRDRQGGRRARGYGRARRLSSRKPTIS